MELRNAILSGAIDKENTENFIRQVEFITSEGKGIKIYLASDGGLSKYSRLIIDFLKEVHRYYNKPVCICAFGHICSAAFDIFFKSPCLNKRILDGVLGVLHKSYLKDVSSNELEDKESFVNFSKRHLDKVDNPIFYDFLDKAGLTDKEIRRIKSGKDLMLSTERLRFILKTNGKGLEEKFMKPIKPTNIEGLNA
jgi:hypothetical protein